MYCKLFIHSNSIKTIIFTLESEFGKTRNEINTYFFDQFDIHLCKNKEADIDKIHIYPDGFLYYEIIADIDIYSNHIQITDKILRILWKNNITTVAACDYEEELNKFVLQS